MNLLRNNVELANDIIFPPKDNTDAFIKKESIFKHLDNRLNLIFKRGLGDVEFLGVDPNFIDLFNMIFPQLDYYFLGRIDSDSNQNSNATNSNSTSSNNLTAETFDDIQETLKHLKNRYSIVIKQKSTLKHLENRVLTLPDVDLNVYCCLDVTFPPN
jgi:hypothetical protein